MILLLLGVMTVSAVGSTPWTAGNTDLNISNGGVMLEDGDTLYYSDNGIFAKTGDSDTRRLCDESGRNLNLAGEYLYYTLDSGEVRRILIEGGMPETVYAHDEEILRLYVIY